MPDVFVPLDTAVYTPYLRAVRRHNIITDLALHYVDYHRTELRTNYPDFDRFISEYEVPAALIDSVAAQAKRKKVVPADSAEWQKSLPDLRFLLKSLIAYNVWDRNEYYRILNNRSDIVKKALEILATDEGKKKRKRSK